MANVTAWRLTSQAALPADPQSELVALAVTKIGADWLMTLVASAYQTSESPPPAFSALTRWKVTGQLPPLAGDRCFHPGRNHRGRNGPGRERGRFGIMNAPGTAVTGGGAFTADEMMTTCAARALRDRMTCFVGIGLPSVAANLARATHAPHLVLIYESGAIGAKPSAEKCSRKIRTPASDGCSDASPVGANESAHYRHMTGVKQRPHCGL